MSENYKQAYSAALPQGYSSTYGTWLSPSPRAQDRAHLTSLLKEAKKRYTPLDREGVATTIAQYGGDTDTALAFMEYEPALFEPPAIKENFSLHEEIRYRSYLKECIDFHTDTKKSLKEWCITLIAVFDEIKIPEQPEGHPIAVEEAATFQTPDTVSSIFFLFFADERNFKPLKEKLWRNYCAANGYDVKDVSDKTRLKPVSDFPYDVIFRDTPVLDLFKATVVVTLPHRSRFEHMWMLAGSGHGKTQSLQFLIPMHFPEVLDGEASVVVIDSQGDLINKLSHLDCFHDTIPITIIDPMQAVENPIALNPFNVTIEGATAVQREQYYNYLIELLNYVFSELNSDLTSKQGLLFNNALRLLLTIPNATILTLRDLFEDKGIAKFQKEINNLDPNIRRFFETEWNNSEYRTTKTQVIRRVYELLSNSTFARMFTAPKSKINFTKEVNTPQVILINTAQELLGQAGCRTFGKFFIGLVVQAALQRAGIEENKRLKTYVYIDEAAQYMNETFETIVTQCRKYRVALTFAHQHLGQLDPKLQSAFTTNTAIKMVGGVSHGDATRLARDMRCDAEDITNLDRGEFQLYVRGNKKPSLYRTPYGFLEKQPRMTDEQYEQLKQRMREKLSHNPDPPPVPPMDVDGWKDNGMGNQKDPHETLKDITTDHTKPGTW